MGCVSSRYVFQECLLQECLLVSRFVCWGLCLFRDFLGTLQASPPPRTGGLDVADGAEVAASRTSDRGRGQHRRPASSASSWHRPRHPALPPALPPLQSWSGSTQNIPGTSTTCPAPPTACSGKPGGCRALQPRTFRGLRPARQRPLRRAWGAAGQEAGLGGGGGMQLRSLACPEA